MNARCRRCVIVGKQTAEEMSSSPSSDMDAFRKIVKKAKHVVFLTGAGVSAESGVPTFRGPGGLWRTFKATDLATPSAFRSNPSLVWEFYHDRRENMLSKSPNNVTMQTAITKIEIHILSILNQLKFILNVFIIK